MTVTTDATATFDLDAARSARAEHVGERFTFQSHGATYTMPTPKEWPIQTTALLSKGDLEGALRSLLGPDQSQEFLAGGPVTMGDIEALFTAVAKWSGVETLPNS